MQATRACAGHPDLAGLQRGGQVCGLCTSKAVREGEVACVGAGVQDKVTSFKMLLETQCSGTWRQLQELDTCPCTENNSFIFV